MAVVSAVKKSISKLPKAIEFVNGNRNATKQFLEENKVFEPEELSALERDINSSLDELYKTPVKIRTSDKGLAGILKDGRYKTQFETGYSKGNYDPESRAYVERDIFGYPINGGTKPSDRPVYGYVGTGDAKSYGNNVIVMRKENKPRTTISNGDSYDEGIDFDGLATPVAWGNNSLDFVGNPDVLDNYLSTYDEHITRNDIKRILSGLKKKKNHDGESYIEAQIHGGVSPSDFAGVLLGDPEKELGLRKSAADKFGFELRTVDPRDRKKKCFYNCKEPTQDKQELLDMIERGDFWRK